MQHIAVIINKIVKIFKITAFTTVSAILTANLIALIIVKIMDSYYNTVIKDRQILEHIQN